MEFWCDLRSILIRSVDQIVQTLGAGESVDLLVSLDEDQDLVHVFDRGLLEVHGSVDPVVVRVRYEVEGQQKCEEKLTKIFRLSRLVHMACHTRSNL